MKLRFRHAAAAAMIGAACSPTPTPAHRGRSESSANPPAEAGPDVTAATVATNAGPAPTSSAGAVVPTSAPAGPTTTVSVTVPTTPRTTTTFVVLEKADEDLTDEEWWADKRGQVAKVSWYGDESGSHTANGDLYNPNGLTFAHRSMAFGTKVLFRGPLGSVVATCTDRGPAAWTGKTFDLSRGAFARVAPLSSGVATVTWERVG